VSPEDQQPQTPQPSISPDALRSFFAEFGDKSMTVHALAAENARLKDVSRKLLAEHGPGMCTPVVADAEGEGG
jgi:hypothetical protein